MRRDTSPAPCGAPVASSPRPGEAARPVYFATTLGIGFCQNVVLAVARFAIPLVALGLGAGVGTVGIVVALLTVAPIIGMIGYGRWIDRVGPGLPSWVATALLLLSALGYAMIPLVQNWAALMTVSLVLGIAFGPGGGAQHTGADLSYRS